MLTVSTLDVILLMHHMPMQRQHACQLVTIRGYHLLGATEDGPSTNIYRTHNNVLHLKQ